ncbi:MAG: aspartate dehydrogenase, partial [Alphaproteobacteria bacterium]|nr:aspartate dehydrogenase [Alphaproteobacteria bacterium]
MHRAPLRVAVAGLGAIGWPVVSRLDEGIPGLVLAAVSASDLARAVERVAALRAPMPVVPVADLAAHADIVVECAPKA